MLKTFWTVKQAILGGNSPIDIYFKDYQNAKEYARHDYRDKPIKHTVKPETFEALENIGAFDHERSVNHE